MVCSMQMKIKPPTKKELDELKLCERESYDSVIGRLIEFYYKTKMEEDGKVK